MAFTSKLAELFVEFAVKGAAKVRAAMDGIKADLVKSNATAEAMAKVMEPAFLRQHRAILTTHNALRTFQDKLDMIYDRLKPFGDVAFWAFSRASVAIGGFVTAGIASSGVGEVLAFRMGELARVIAGLFGPEIRKVIDWIGSLTDWIRSLSAETKQSVVQWTASVGAFVLVISWAPKLIAMIRAIIAAVKAYTISVLMAQAATGPKGWAGALGSLAVMLGAAGAAYGAFKLFEGKEGAGGREELPRKTVGFEGLQERYERLAVAAVMATSGGRDPALRTAEATEESKDILEQIRDWFRPDWVHRGTGQVLR